MIASYLSKNFLYLFVSCLFSIWITRNVFFWVNLWQIKEYRLDRLKAHLLNTNQGKRLIFGVENILKNVVFLLFFISIFYDKLSSYYYLFILFVFIESFIKVIYEVLDRRIKFPVLTIKAVVAVFITLLTVYILYAFPLLDKFFWLLFIDRLVVLIIALEIMLLFLPSDFYKDWIIYKAVKKRNNFKNLLVIGVTGSYGKGSTKEFIASILSEKFSLVKTFGNNNTSIGVAKTINKLLKPGKKIFVAEMGAYKKGEIKEICSIAKPRIGVLTAVDDQHIALFGDIKNTMETKYELIESLPNNGFSVFSANNQNSLTLANRTRRKKVIYFADYNNTKRKYDINAINIKINKFSISFDIDIKGEIIHNFKVKLLGKYNTENLLPGIYLAKFLGMSWNQIREAVKKIYPIKKTMEPFMSTSEAVFVDDTYNSGYASVNSALEYMEIYKGKKFLVLSPLIELGKNASFDYIELGKKIGVICDYLILMNNDFIKDIKNGITSSGSGCEIIQESPKRIAEFIKVTCIKSDVVVFEGREACAVLKFLEYEKIN